MSLKEAEGKIAQLMREVCLAVSQIDIRDRYLPRMKSRYAYDDTDFWKKPDIRKS